MLPPTTDSDAWLHDKVKIILLFHQSVAPAVNGKDGILILRGEDASKAQKELTAEHFRDVEAVIDVNNLMTVSLASIKTETTNMEENIDDVSITGQVKLALLYHRSINPIIPARRTMVTLRCIVRLVVQPY